jgi:hypothetical protein
MKKNLIRLFVLLILAIVISCDEPDTVVTNIIHQDGSVTRKIEMRNTKNVFNKADLQLPFDNTWKVTDIIEVSGKGDTTWIKRAEKIFKNAEDINLTYQNDTAINGQMVRHAALNKNFRWFNTEYRFSETVDKQISSGYTVHDFLNDEELTYFYSPDYIKFNKENGSDSIKYKIIADSIDKKSEKWIIKNIASLWIEEFTKLAGSKAGPELSMKALKSREDEIVTMITESEGLFDSLWTAGVFLKKIIGETEAMKFSTEADSALTLALEMFLWDFSDYSVRIAMPGRLIATNGYIDSTSNLLWPVKSDFFLTDQYEMWAESKTTNIWAWIVSGLFLVFVATGIFIKKM